MEQHMAQLLCQRYLRAGLDLQDIHSVGGAGGGKHIRKRDLSVRWLSGGRRLDHQVLQELGTWYTDGRGGAHAVLQRRDDADSGGSRYGQVLQVHVDIRLRQQDGHRSAGRGGYQRAGLQGGGYGSYGSGDELLRTELQLYDAADGCGILLRHQWRYVLYASRGQADTQLRRISAGGGQSAAGDTDGLGEDEQLHQACAPENRGRGHGLCCKDSGIYGRRQDGYGGEVPA